MKGIVLCLLLVGVFAYNQKTINAGRACTRLIQTFLSTGWGNVIDAIQDKRHLDRNLLEEKILSDMFDYCVFNISEEDITKVKKAQGKYNWEDVPHLFVPRVKHFHTNEDLEVSPEHHKLRAAILHAEGQDTIDVEPEVLEKIKATMKKDEL